MHTSSALTNHSTPPNRRHSVQQTEVGRIISVGASKAIVSINKRVISKGNLDMAQLGTILKIVTRDSLVVAMVSSLDVERQDHEGMHDGCVAQLDILGEITSNAVTGSTRFFRGVRQFPVLNEAVYTITQADLEIIFNREKEPCIEVGRLQQDDDIIAKVRIDDLLSKHFAIIGSTGSGKSCTVALVLQAILDTNQNAHVVLFDPHNEYSHSFGPLGEVIRGNSLDLPLWMFNFEETVEFLCSDQPEKSREEQEVLHQLILKAKQMYEKSKEMKPDVTAQAQIDDLDLDLARVAPHISLDSPVPYRIHDILKLINHYMGKLENSSNLAPYLRLQRRIKTLMTDPRYQFAFRNQAAPSDIGDVIGRIFRVPVNGRPISILDFSSIPSETLNIVVSVVSRLAFDLAVWSDRKIPILLVCEEAHRYIPADEKLGFRSTRRTISRIAKEGRKYGVSLAIVSQRPSELEPSTLSQCSTIFSMRLTNEVDQNFVRAAIPDGASELLTFIPSLGTAEAMVFGESVNMPMRVILNTLEEDRRPHSSSASFSKTWADAELSPAFMQGVYRKWRTRSSGEENASSPHAVQAPAQRSAPTLRRVPPQNPQSGMQAAMSSRTARQATSPETPKRSLADVRKVLNGAFNKDL